MMRFRNVIKEKLQERRRKLRTWHTWFAWFPVRVFASGPNRFEYVWLEKIDRRLQHAWSGGHENLYFAYDIPAK